MSKERVEAGRSRRDLALILCDGEPPTREHLLAWHHRAAHFIAADGGGNVAAALGVRPDDVVGDLDSYRRESFPDLEPVYDPDQERNDLEKALELALMRGAGRAVVLGATGLRLDHALKNLSVMSRFAPRLELWFEDRFGEIRLLTRAHPRLSVRGQVGQVISLFPLSGRVDGVVTRGLAYPLYDEPLENGVRDGSSNTLSEPVAEVSIRHGELVVFIQHGSDHPPGEDRT